MSRQVLPLTMGACALLLCCKLCALASVAFAADGGSGSTPPDPVAASSPALPAQKPAIKLDAAPTPMVRPAPVAPPVPGVPAVGRAAVGSAAGAGSGATADHPAALSELLSSLRSREAELDRRSASLDAREAALSEATSRLGQRVADLKLVEARVSAAEQAVHTQDEKSWASLVKVYEAMRPGSAAAIFDLLDNHIMIQVLDRMNERKASLILAAMQPERARLATQLLAQLHRAPAAANSGGSG